MVRESRTKQVNVRLTKRAHDVIRALAFLADTSEADLVHEAIDRYVATREKDPAVQEALKLLAHYRGRAEGSITDLPGRKGHRPSQ